MALYGVISRTPKLRRKEWSACIDQHPQLLRRTWEPREIDNPFKPGTKAVVTPPPDLANLIEDGSAVGAVEPSEDFDQDGELLVWAPEDKVTNARRVSDALARHLNARLQWVDDR